MKNILGNSSSPYLLQHKDNPIHWQVWGKEAFEKAKKEDKPVFISIGYSSCHWCHVMAHESFENDNIAEYLNQNFISIKVDREEHPDVDALYMNATQIMTGSGGWPISVFAMPDGKPFLCGTYYPPEPRFGRDGFPQLIERINGFWKKDRDKLISTADEMNNYLNSATKNNGLRIEIDDSLLGKALNDYQKDFDEEEGGFGVRPKFPSFQNLIFLMRLAELYDNKGKSEQAKTSRDMISKTLTAIARNGITDHIGGGIHRYSTDAYWHLPHFEKMLYDQAMYLWALCENTGGNSDILKYALKTTAEYLDREMTDGTLYYSAQDADTSEGEGVYYMWTTQEMKDIEKEFATKFQTEISTPFADIFGMSEQGNYYDEATHKLTGKNILTLRNWPDNQSPSDAEGWDVLTKLILDKRSQREKPLLDTKVLTDLNGMLACGFIRCGLAVNNDYLDKADRIINFYQKYFKENGRLPHTLVDGIATNPVGTLDDYGFVASASLDQFMLTGNANDLSFAIKLISNIETLFSADSGDYFLAVSNELLPSRPMAGYDSATPSGASVIYGTLLKLFHLTGESKYMARAHSYMASKAAQISQYPKGFAMMLSYYTEETIGRKTYLFDNLDKQQKEKIIDKYKIELLSGAVIINRDAENAVELDKFIEWLPEYDHTSKPTMYKCENFSCKMPVKGLDNIIKSLGSDQYK